jgi:hypothetical protein
MQLELDEQALPEGATTKPVAGYLYFPAGKKKYDKFELRYEADAANIRLPLPPPVTK